MPEFNLPPNLQRPATQNEAAEPSVVPTQPSYSPPKGKTVTREKRRPFGNQIQKLAYEARAGYHRHWFNDSPGRIETALEAGYTHVEDKEGKKVSRVVGVNPAGGPQMGFLMEIPEEWYEEDMARQATLNKEREDAIRTGSVADSRVKKVSTSQSNAGSRLPPAGKSHSARLFKSTFLSWGRFPWQMLTWRAGLSLIAIMMVAFGTVR